MAKKSDTILSLNVREHAYEPQATLIDNYLNSAVGLTFDLDWANDYVIADTIELLIKANVKATFFVTHQTSVFDGLSQDFEGGIHPNFDKSNDFDLTIQNLLEIVPEAIGVRSHRLCQSSPILQAFMDNGLEYDCNLLMCKQSDLRPFINWNGLVRIPYFWEDDVHCIFGDPWTLDVLPMNSPGLKIFDFHPIHIFLNTETLDRYEVAKKYYHQPKVLEEYRNSGRGTRDFLINLLEYIRENQILTYTLNEINNLYQSGDIQTLTTPKKD